MLSDLLDNNREWAEKVEKDSPGFFKKLAAQQKPEYLWIGCSDSRVPANEIVGLMPGELFVHRNIANLVQHIDLNCISVLHYAVDVLKVKHIIVCGHYGCGGVRASLGRQDLGLIDNWIRHLKDTGYRYRKVLEKEEGEARVNKLCELNVMQQVENVCKTRVVQRAWKEGRELAVHGWIYGIEDGVIKDLKVDVTDFELMPDIFCVE